MAEINQSVVNTTEADTKVEFAPLNLERGFTEEHKQQIRKMNIEELNKHKAHLEKIVKSFSEANAEYVGSGFIDMPSEAKDSNEYRSFARALQALEVINEQLQKGPETEGKRGVGGALQRLVEGFKNAYQKDGQPRGWVKEIVKRLPLEGLKRRILDQSDSSSQPELPIVESSDENEQIDTNSEQNKKRFEWIRQRLNREVPAEELNETIRAEVTAIQEELGSVKDAILGEIAQLEQSILKLEELVGSPDADQEELLPIIDRLQSLKDELANRKDQLAAINKKRRTVGLFSGRSVQTLRRYEEHKIAGNREKSKTEQARLQEILRALQEFDPREAQTKPWGQDLRESMTARLQEAFGENGKLVDVKRLWERAHSDPELRDALLATGLQLGAGVLLPGSTLASVAYAPVKVWREERSIRRADDAEAKLQQKYRNLTDRFQSRDSEEPRKMIDWLKGLGKVGINVLTSFENAWAKIRVAPDRKRGKVSSMITEMRVQGIQSATEAPTIPNDEQIEGWLADLVSTENTKDLRARLAKLQELLSHLIDLDLIQDDASPVMLQGIFGEGLRRDYSNLTLNPGFMTTLREKTMRAAESLFDNKELLQAIENAPGFSGYRLRDTVDSVLEMTRPNYRSERAKKLLRSLYRGEIFGVAVRGVIFDKLSGRLDPQESAGTVVTAREPVGEPAAVAGERSAPVSEVVSPIDDTLPNPPRPEPQPFLDPSEMASQPAELTVDTSAVHQDYLDAYSDSVQDAAPNGSLVLRNQDGSLPDGSAVIRDAAYRPEQVIPQFSAVNETLAQNMEVIANQGLTTQFEQIVIDIERSIGRTLNPQEYANLSTDFVKNFQVGDGVTTPIEQIALTDDADSIRQHLQDMDVLVQ